LKPLACLRRVVTDGDGYLVEIKPSARRTNAAAGRAINRAGARREFPDRAAAEAWAADLSADDPVVWIRTANPGDDAVDGYLMGRRRLPTAGAGETTPPGEQEGVDAF
jgi:hypothetical protein